MYVPVSAFDLKFAPFHLRQTLLDELLTRDRESVLLERHSTSRAEFGFPQCLAVLCAT